MQNGIHFISGLPRCGSALVAALLLQNPSLHAGITSAVGSFVGTMLHEVSQGNEAAVMIDDAEVRWVDDAEVVRDQRNKCDTSSRR
jgi:sulfotransferase